MGDVRDKREVAHALGGTAVSHPGKAGNPSPTRYIDVIRCIEPAERGSDSRQQAPDPHCLFLHLVGRSRSSSAQALDAKVPGFLLRYLRRQRIVLEVEELQGAHGDFQRLLPRQLYAELTRRYNSLKLLNFHRVRDRQHGYVLTYRRSVLRLYVPHPRNCAGYTVPQEA